MHYRSVGRRALSAIAVAGLLSVATSAQATDVTAAVAPEGTLRVAVFADATTLDPQMTIRQLGYYPLVAYDTLVRLNAADEPEPWLATSWEQTSATSWTFTLRDDVTFHDGSMFDAETVKANFERAKTLESSPNAGLYADIDTVEVIDPTTVVINLAGPRPSLLSDLAEVGGAMISPKAIADGLDLTRAEAGSGGWVWDPSALREGSLHVYRANPDYWNPEAVRVETVELHVIADPNARLNAVDTGQVDVAGTVQPNQIDGAESAGLTVVSRFYLTAALVIIDTDGELVPALGDVRVRQAIGLLIDRQAINEAVYAGHGDPNPAGYFGVNSPWYCEPCDDLLSPTADVEGARALLAEAGYADGFTLRIATNENLRLVLGAVAQMLAEGNITLEIETAPTGTLGTVNRSGEYPVAYTGRSESHPAAWYSDAVSSTSPLNPLDSDLMVPIDELAADAVLLTDADSAAAAWDAVQVATLEAGRLFAFGSSPYVIAVADTVATDLAPRPDFPAILPHYVEVG